MSNEDRIAVLEIRAAVEQLVLIATKHKAAVAGFVWGADPPVFVRFSNVEEEGPALCEILLRLSDLAEEKQAQGLVVHNPIVPPSVQ